MKKLSIIVGLLLLGIAVSSSNAAAASSISGTVTTNTGPIKGVWVQVYGDKCWNNELGGAETDASGIYTVNGLPDSGQVYVHTCAAECNQMNYVDRWYGNRIDCNNAAPVPLQTGQTTGSIDFFLPPGGSLSGHIEDSSGTPIQGLRVGALNSACSGLWFSGGDTDASGNYTIYGLPVGNVYAWTCSDCNGRPYEDKYYNNARDCSQASSVSISANVNTLNIDFTLDDDSDNDDMADSWENDHFGDLTHDGNADSDGDGLNDRDEYRHQTDPNDTDTDNDAITDGYEVQQGTDPTNGSDTPPIPITGSVMNVHQADGSYATLVEVVIENGFADIPASDIDSITISGPRGFSLTKDDLDYIERWRDFYTYVPDGSPATGQYTFTVHSVTGLTGSDTDNQDIIRQIPVPAGSDLQPADGATVTSKTPILSWKPVDFPAADMYYRVTIDDSTGWRVFATNRDKGRLSVAVPQGVLTPGETYTWRVRVTDSSDWVATQNRANSAWQSFTVAATQSHSSLPAIDLDGLGVANWASATWNGRNTWVKIVDQDGIAYDGSSHAVTVTPPTGPSYPLQFQYSNGAMTGYYSAFTTLDSPMESGDYTFTVTDPDGNSSTFVDHMDVNTLDPVAEDSLQPSNENPVQQYATATVDNVYVDGSSYDNFDSYSSIDELDPSKWGYRNGDVALINASPSGKMLQFNITHVVGRGDSAIDFANAAAINSTKADITLVNASSDACFSRISWYNEDDTGEQHGSAQILVHPDSVTYTVSENFYSNGTMSWNILASGTLESVSLNQKVTASISWNAGTRTLTFDADGQTATYTYPAGVTLPNWVEKSLRTRINLITSTTPTFSWTAVPDAATYRVRIYSWDKSNTIWKGYTGGTTYTVPPGVLAPNSYYRYRVDARDAHSGFDIDNDTRTPANSSDFYRFYTDDQPAVDPYIEFDSHGAFTWNNATDGSELGFWIKVHDAQGVPGDIASVTVDMPGGGTETLDYDGGYAGTTATSGYYNKFNLPLPANGDHNYTFHVTDNEGHTYSVDETLHADLLDPMNASSVTATYNAAAHAVDFSWDALTGAAFYRVEIYENPATEYNILYRFTTTTNSYRMPEGFLKKGVLYRYRITARREFFDENVDNGSSTHSINNPDSLPTVMIGPVASGDINADGQIDLADTVLALQVVTGITPATAVQAAADINNDGKIGLAEAIHVLQVVSGLRPSP